MYQCRSSAGLAESFGSPVMAARAGGLGREEIVVEEDVEGFVGH